MLPCVVIDFLLNNQPDALIILIYSVIKLYTFENFLCPSSGVFYCTLALESFMQVFDDRFKAESGCSILTPFGTPDDG
jgi:hypothetical protein